MSNILSDTSKQDEYLKSNISNMVQTAQFKYYAKFTDFLDERQQAIAVKHLKTLGYQNYSFFGGAEDCERTMLGIFSPNASTDSCVFPIKTIQIEYSDRVEISHRDCLGALMGLQIKRSSIGDIIIADGKAIFFVTDDIASFILLNLNKVSKANVKVSINEGKLIEKKQGFDIIEGTVSSLRLDCVVSLLTSKSRSVSAQMIQSQMVKVNHFDIENVSYMIKPNDVVAIRGKGKFIIGSETKLTKKNRLYITVKKLL